MMRWLTLALLLPLVTACPELGKDFPCTVEGDCRNGWHCGAEGICVLDATDGGSGPVCGNSSCETGESVASCPADCTGTCGDGFCSGGESPATCAADCTCGNGTCEPTESTASCSVDCRCGNGTCDNGEDGSTCSGDCTSTSCGNDVCEVSENSVTCPVDCGVCGDGTCDAGETPASCAADCDRCGNGLCDAGETAASCAADCSGACETAPCSPVPDSTPGLCSDGQQAITCPTDPADAFYGQDGLYLVFPQDYQDLATGVVRDRLTGLEWPSTPLAMTYDKADAVLECEDLILGGNEDWRLPTLRELMTLLDYNHTSSQAAINRDFFLVPTLSPSQFWSADAYAYDSSRSWAPDFDGHGDWAALNNTRLQVRCVRGNAPVTGELRMIGGTGTLVDQRTGLHWPNQDLGAGALDWNRALSFCENSEHGGQTDWRLPSLKELMSVVDVTALAPATYPSLETTFTVNVEYWTSTPTTFSIQNGALTVDMWTGDPSWVSETSDRRLTCVRGGNVVAP